MIRSCWGSDDDHRHGGVEGDDDDHQEAFLEPQEVLLEPRRKLRGRGGGRQRTTEVIFWNQIFLRSDKIYLRKNFLINQILSRGARASI